VRALEFRRHDAAIADLIARSEKAAAAADALEAKLHNPTAEIVYDILAMRGGARLYSRLAPLQMWAVEGEGPPTAGMQQVLAAHEQELAALAAETEQFLAREVAPLNALAAKLSVAFVVVR
jgi:hypothetical protein